MGFFFHFGLKPPCIIITNHVSKLQVSGLSAWVGEQLEGLSYLDDWVMNLLISAAVAGFTEVTSNTATAQLLLPVLGNMVR